jgi:molybdate transport system substrate-binding protein
MRESIEELAAAYEKQSGVHVLFNFAGSNELARQIIAAPKADIFLSAAKNWMDTVETANRLVAGTRRDLLSNTLVVVGNAQSTATIDAPCALGTMKFKNLSLGDPEAVPAGKYARQWLSSIQCDGDTLWNKVKDRVAPAPDVRAALGLVLADPDVIGIVYKTDQMAFTEKTRILHEVKDGPPIQYIIAQVNEGSDAEGARGFLDYLSGSEAATVFQRHGFGVISSQTTQAAK